MKDTCDVCNHCMTHGNMSMAGYTLELEDSVNPEKKRVMAEFGKLKFKICYVCLLKALGVKGN